LQPRLIC